MRADFHEDDPRIIWQNQRTETSAMSLILIRQKARELQKRRHRQVFGTVVAPVVVAFFYAFCVKQFPHLQQTLHLLFVVALVWSVAGTYVLNRGISSREMPGEAGFSTGLEFCRRDIEGQLSYLRRVVLWSLGPILVAIGTFVLALSATTSIFPKGIPFITLVVVWIAAYLFLGARQQRELRRELDELNEIATGNG